MHHARLVLAGIILALVIVISQRPTCAEVDATWSQGGRTHFFERSAWRPLVDPRQDALALEIGARHRSQRSIVDLSLRGAVSVVRGSGRQPAADIFRTDHSDLCRAIGGLTQCHIPVASTDEVARLTLVPDTGHPARVVSIALRCVKILPISAFSGGRALIALLIIVLMTPVLWLIHAHRVLSQWTIVAVAATCLVIVEPLFAAALVALVIAAFVVGRRATHDARGARLLAGLGAALGFLMLTKYADVSALFPRLGAFGVGLPLGVSYFVIRLIDTQLRWFRGEQRDLTLREYLCFLLFPATIPAGPIDTIDHFRRARAQSITKDAVVRGVARMLFGVLKKVIIVDFLLYPRLFGTGAAFERITADPASVPRSVIVLGLTLSLVYAYLDFSAYSDIAIGLGRLHGQDLPENFNMPLIADGLRDFWRRWHITLSQWCMRNIYLPVAVSTRTNALALFATMLAVGLWHAVDWSWFAWAVHHSAGLSVGAAVAERRRIAVPRLLRAAITITFVVAGHAFVLIDDFPTSWLAYLHFWRALLPL